MPFKSLGLHPLLVRAVRNLGYDEPTPVQGEAILTVRRNDTTSDIRVALPD